MHRSCTHFATFEDVTLSKRLTLSCSGECNVGEHPLKSSLIDSTFVSFALSTYLSGMRHFADSVSGHLSCHRLFCVQMLQWCTLEDDVKDSGVSWCTWDLGLRQHGATGLKSISLRSCQDVGIPYNLYFKASQHVMPDSYSVETATNHCSFRASPTVHGTHTEIFPVC